MSRLHLFQRTPFVRPYFKKPAAQSSDVVDDDRHVLVVTTVRQLVDAACRRTRTAPVIAHRARAARSPARPAGRSPAQVDRLEPDEDLDARGDHAAPRTPSAASTIGVGAGDFVRASLDDHHRNVLGANPSRPLNTSAVSPLARHRSTRLRHLLVVSVISRHDAPRRSLTPDAARAADTALQTLPQAVPIRSPHFYG